MTRAFASHRTAHNRNLRASASAKTGDLNLTVRRGQLRELCDKAKATSLSGAAEDAGFVMAFGQLSSRALKAPAPLESECDRIAAEGFVLLCRAWVQRHPSRRDGLAEAVGAAARLVDDLLTEEQTRAAQVWMRQSGGGD